MSFAYKTRFINFKIQRSVSIGVAPQLAASMKVRLVVSFFLQQYDK